MRRVLPMRLPVARAHNTYSIAAITLGALALAVSGCGSNYTALSPGSSMPALTVEGWANDTEPGELSGKVVVIEAFATW